MMDLEFICDDARHIICLPYSIENLHRMACRLGLKRCWFHNHPTHPHYDMPKLRIEQITKRCRVVSQRELLALTKSTG